MKRLVGDIAISIIAAAVVVGGLIVAGLGAVTWWLHLD